MDRVVSQAAPMGVWRLTLLVAGNIIGSGIFLLPTALARYGTISLLAWGFTALGAIVLALTFAELSAVLGSEGGFYKYCREAFGDFVGFQVAYSYWIALWVGNAALVVALTGYLSFFWPILNSNAWVAWATNVSILWALTLLNIFRLREMIMLQMSTTVLKLLPLLFVAVLGLFYIDFSHFSLFNLTDKSHGLAFNEAATITLWSFLGLESASLSSGYIQNPKRDIPRATLWGVLLAAVLYIGGYAAMIGMVPLSDLMYSAAPYADAIQPWFGTWASQLMAVIAAFSCLGSLAGWILLQGQMPLAAARDKLFPQIFLYENNNKVPVAGLVISSALITLLLSLQLNQSLVSQFTFIIVLATFASLVPYFFTSMAAIVLVNKYINLFRQRRSLTLLLTSSVLGSMYAFWAIMGAGQEVILYGCALLLSSLPAYVGVQWALKHKAVVNQ